MYVTVTSIKALMIGLHSCVAQCNPAALLTQGVDSGLHSCVAQCNPAALLTQGVDSVV